MTPRVSVVIVSYRSRDSLAECLPALAACRERVALEAIVVDNDSGDGTVEWLRTDHPWVNVFASPRNDGYASGVDRGLEHAHGAAFLILNPDCVVMPGSLERLLRELETSDRLAAVAPALLDRAGCVARSCGRFPTLWTLVCDHLGLASFLPHTRLCGGYKYGERAMASLSRVDWVSGAALLLPRSAVERVGELDRNIFMYMEEVDWCRRAATLGLEVRYVPDAAFVHHGQRSSSQEPRATYLHNLRARVYYFRKHHGRLAAEGARAVLIVSLAAKWIVTALRSGLEGARVYARGMRAVWEPPQEDPT
jgi:GT2 family glycosyltransferase